MEVFDDWIDGDLLGSGNFGVVMLQHKRDTAELRVVKEIKIDAIKFAAEEADREANVMAHMDHINVIKFLGQAYSSDMQTKYIYMEYGSGGSIFDEIVPGEGIPYKTVHLYMLDIIEGLGYMHFKGITHRDIKPENLVLGIDGNVKICDFGFAAFYSKEGLVLTKMCGTIPYMAPEIYLQTYNGPSVDIWALGITFLYMTTGELPWPEAKESCLKFKIWMSDTYFLKVPWHTYHYLFLNFIRTMLAMDPADRPTAHAVKCHQWLARPNDVYDY